MEVGLALPTMATGYDRSTTVDWCRGIDAGPFSSVSCGERITYHNQEMLVTNAAAAALTERVRVFVNLVVGPLHRTAVLAKQLATLDVLAGGRLTVGLGVGGREGDYRAAESPFTRRHARLDEQVADLRRYWSGEPPTDQSSRGRPGPGPARRPAAAGRRDGAEGAGPGGGVGRGRERLQPRRRRRRDAPGQRGRHPGVGRRRPHRAATAGVRLLLRARRRGSAGGPHPLHLRLPRGVRRPLRPTDERGGRGLVTRPAAPGHPRRRGRRLRRAHPRPGHHRPPLPRGRHRGRRLAL